MATASGTVLPDLRSALLVLSAAPTLFLGAVIYANKERLCNAFMRFINEEEEEEEEQPRKGKEDGVASNYCTIVDEVFQEELVVERGCIPNNLEGIFIRATATPMFQPLKGYRWFDDDGMIHGVRLKDGGASFCNRFVGDRDVSGGLNGRAQHQELGADELQSLRVEASKLCTFVHLGEPSGRLSLMSLMLGAVREVLKFLLKKDGRGTATRALAFHAHRLIAMNGTSLPHVTRIMCNGVIESMENISALNGQRVVAHPKVDPHTGETCFVGSVVDQQPYVKAGVLHPNGALNRTWDIDVPYPTLMHDMAFTKNYIVLLHLPLCFDPQAMTGGQSALPFTYKEHLPARIGLLHRDLPVECGCKVQWFSLPSFFAFHVANAYEDETGCVKLCAPAFRSFKHALQLKRQGIPISDAERPQPFEFTLDPSSGVASMRKLADLFGEFPVIHPGKASHRARYTWLATFDRSDTPDFNGIAKIDMLAPEGLEDACMGTIRFPANCFGGEACFVPAHYHGLGLPHDPSQAAELLTEDYGWLLVYVYHANEAISKLHIYNAHTMSSIPVAIVRLPQRVPFGFHNTWITQEQIDAGLVKAFM